MHTIRVITRLAYNGRRTERASAPSRFCLGFVLALPQLRLDYALALISWEHCRSSRNNPYYAPRHIIYYFTIMLHFHQKNSGNLVALLITSFKTRWHFQYTGKIVLSQNLRLFGYENPYTILLIFSFLFSRLCWSSEECITHRDNGTSLYRAHQPAIKQQLNLTQD